MLKECLQQFRQWNRQRNYFLKRLRLNVARWLFDWQPSYTDAPIKRILFLRDDDKFGDMVISTISFRELKKAGFQVNVVTGPHNGQVIAGNPNIERVFVHRSGWLDTLKLGCHLRRYHFDLVIDVGDEVTPQHLFFLRLIGGKHILGFNKQDYCLYDLNVDYPETGKHISCRHEAVLHTLGQKDVCLDYQLVIPKAIEEEVQEYLAKYTGQYIIALNPTTAVPQKDLSITQVKALVELIGQHVGQAVIVISGDAQTKQYFRMPGTYGLPFDDLMAAVALIKHADLVISPDTAMVHVAAAFSKPAVTLYRQDKPGGISSKEWGPNNDQAIQLLTPQVFDEVASIDVQEIFAAVIQQYQRWLRGEAH